ncbi:MAG: TetR family transcriptional regulator [Actinophytocola sp.]|uniref:TetR/AcrR family transcriptional regulator n=1 Tax=Actinophytocola sp. TaxID=1872138 RepID=UPI001324D724|nr:TetR/AcrR family transcriptional regulator [Actinophytocola sp.]MPZ84855.1 TetR family transcriptional regulator [Actinophytocola sp.]
MTETTRSRRRGAELEHAILDAAWDELTEVGYAGLTIEAVATRAGTSKPVIYRRWSNRAELVLAAWGRHVPVRQATPDTGALRTDLIAMFARIARRVDTVMHEVVAGVMGEAFRHPEVAGLLRKRLETAPFGDVVRTVVERAVARGELPPVDMSSRATRLPLDLVRGESLLKGNPITDETIADLVDDVYLPLLRGLPGLPEPDPASPSTVD